VLKFRYYKVLLYIAVVLTIIALVQYGYRAFKRNAPKG